MGPPAASQMSKRKLLIIGAAAAFTVAVVIIIVVVTQVKNSDYCKDCMAVASDNDVCTNIGASILRKGGSGVDATIAILLCLGAVQPQSNGIGGGGFMLVHTKTEDKVISFRERAPANATEKMYVDDKELAKTGGLAVGIPGEVMGHWVAHQRYGKLPWKDLFTPTIKILREGIEVSHHMEMALRDKKDILIKYDNFKAMFFTGDEAESYKRIGDTFTNPKMAAAYEKIAEEGPDGFYKGSVAENIVRALKERGGIMTMEDLAGYNVTIDEPLKFQYRGQSIISAPPPASGHVIALTLQILDNFDLASYGTLKAWNYIIEAMRFGYAMRSKTGDSLFSELTKNVVKQVKDGTYMKKLVKEHFVKESYDQLVPYKDYSEYSNPIYGNYDGTHTTHVSVLGPEGEAVACTSTVNLYFGSRVMTADGIVMNNEMDDFSTPGFKNAFGYDPSPENFIVPGKRPMSSSSPSIVFDSDGEATFVTGAAGGSRIISGTLLSLINALDFKMPLDESLRAARIHDQLNEQTLYEMVPGVDHLNARIKAGLSDLGYNMTVRKKAMSTVTSVSKLYGKNEAAGDPRKNGTGIILEL